MPRMSDEDLIEALVEIDEEDFEFTEWEESFLATMIDKSENQDYSLTTRQREAAERILAKHGE